MEIEKVKLPLLAAYEFGARRGLNARIDAIKQRSWSDSTSAFRRGLIIDLFRREGVLDEFKESHWPFGNTDGGISKIKYYEKIRNEIEQAIEEREYEEDQIDDEAGLESGESQRFAAESDLRDFLAQHPACIEEGLTIYNEGGRSGVEFKIDSGRIDLLARDRDQRLVVIELKVGRGRNRTIGQLLYYMGWIDKAFCTGKPCRGMIIAKDIGDDLAMAVQRVPDVTLHRYDLSVTVRQV